MILIVLTEVYTPNLSRKVITITKIAIDRRNFKRRARSALYSRDVLPRTLFELTQVS